jgi:hypothetical protein
MVALSIHKNYFAPHVSASDLGRIVRGDWPCVCDRFSRL